MGTVGLAYFYCDVSDAKKRGVTDTLSSLVVQLLAWQPSDQPGLDKTYEGCMRGLSKPSNDRLHEALKQFISGLEMAYIFIDALDECLEVEDTDEIMGHSTLQESLGKTLTPHYLIS